jgi:hypothetical protein
MGRSRVDTGLEDKLAYSSHGAAGGVFDADAGFGIDNLRQEPMLKVAAIKLRNFKVRKLLSSPVVD